MKIIEIISLFLLFLYCLGEIKHKDQRFKYGSIAFFCILLIVILGYQIINGAW